MKKILLMCSLGLATLALTSCNSQKTVAQQETKVENPSLYKLKGDWKITSVNYDSKKFRIKPFDEGVDAQCFVGSTWKLIPNNNSGSYHLSGDGNCASITQAIKFEVTKNQEFKFKKLVQNVKAKHVTEGYILQLINHQTNSFTLVQNIPFEGEVLKVYYQFERISTK